ncbi:MAG: FtsX-like permease family protein, partial [Acidimicrobiales bacterium]
DGVDVDAVGEALGADWEVERIEPPIRIVDLAQIRNLPLVLAGAAGVLGIGLLAHALVVTVRRRGRDLALVRALGARPRETVATVLAMMAIIIVIGVAAGIPLGVLAGNLAWRAVADSLYVADDLAVPVLVVLACLPIALLVGLLTAVLPGRRASRLEVAAQLREE